MSSARLPRIVLLASLALGLASAVQANADIVFELGNNPQPGEENILLKPDNQMGSTIFGITNQSGITVNLLLLVGVASVWATTPAVRNPLERFTG